MDIRKKLEKQAFEVARNKMIDLYNEKLKHFESELKQINGEVSVNINQDLKGNLDFKNVNEDLRKRIIEYLK
ncbi:hypothetical protein SAMN05444411_102593 [Lutibacter oricola]|uniref:Uncharacterized protein n=1 Tax=Lutibacter oricola TaxID=762486 RepID=A0A1H2XYZ4_9FLAO|nr:lipase chaperone [Lutibacter oricola]SDW98060.1 hypothetical protein SAMN05444411_102593 [Lutibacter oricola]